MNSIIYLTKGQVIRVRNYKLVFDGLAGNVGKFYLYGYKQTLETFVLIPVSFIDFEIISKNKRI